MTPARSPYRTAPGSEPPELAGRAGELGAGRYAIDMAAQREPPNPIVFVGLRGVGKTAMLRHLAREAREAGALTIVAEADRDLRMADVMRDELATALRSSAKFPKKLSSAIERLVEHLPKLSYQLPHEAGAVEIEGGQPALEDPSDDLESELLRLNDQLHDHGRFLMLGLDEIQESSRRELLRLVRVVHKTAGTERPVLFFGAGLPNTPALLKDVRTYTERWMKFTLGLLDKRATFDALERPAEELGVMWETAALERLYEVSLGYPYFIQQYAAAAWLRAKAETITLAHVEAIVPGISRTLDASLYEPAFRQLTPREMQFALALATLGEGAHRLDEIARRLDAGSSANISSLRTQMVKKEVAIVPNRGFVEFRVPLTIDYIARHREAFERFAAS